MEYTVEGGSAPFPSRATFRASMPNFIQDGDNFFRWGVLIDADGDLGLILSTSGFLSLPVIANLGISNENMDLKFYLMIDSWSYYPPSEDYADGSVISLAKISFPVSGHFDFTDLQPIGGFTYKLYYANIPSSATWTSSSPDITIDAIGSTYVTLRMIFVDPTTTLTGNITASYLVGSTPTTKVQNVTFNFITDPLAIIPLTISCPYYLTTAFPLTPIGISAIPTTQYAKGAVSWEIDGPNTVGCTASFTLSGKLVVTEIDASTPGATVGIIAKDTRYYLTTGTLDCASDGITLTVATGTVDTSKVIGAQIIVDSTGPVTRTILTASGGPVVITVDSAIPGAPFTGASFQIEVINGKASYIVPVNMVNQDT
jgi:hypothetical protein